MVVMYEVLHFRGGMYRFDELSEFVEDVGGLVLLRDHFEIIRGDSYLSTEVHVLLMVPEEELKDLKSIIVEIKGMSEDVEITDEQKIHLLSYLSIYDALNKNKEWTLKEDLKSLMVCPCYAMLCKNSGDDECLLNQKLDEILEEMCSNEIIESSIHDGKVFYRLKKKD
jgi:hypothetical protein